MAANIETFKALFPELCTVKDAVIDVWLVEAKDYLCPSSWGKCFDRACLWFTAHELSMAQQRAANTTETNGATIVSGGTNQVQSASADGMSVSYATPRFITEGSADDNWYAQTTYGLKYLKLRESCIASGQLAGTVQNTAQDQRFF